MLAARQPRVLRSLVMVVAAAIAVPLFGPATSASADEGVSSGDTVVGELVQAWAEPGNAAQAVDSGRDGPLSWIDTGHGESIRVPTDDVAHVPVGSTVEVTIGGQVHDAAAADGMDPARKVLAAEVVRAGATGQPAPTAAAGAVTNAVTVVMAVPAGGTRDTTTLQQMVDTVNGPVAAFWAGQSHDTIRLGVTGTRDWFQASVGCADPAALWAQAAAAAGWTPGPGKHLAVYVSSLPADLTGCSFGLGEVGGGIGAGGRLYVRAPLPSVIAHEFGHNFGLGHSSEIQCDGQVEGPDWACRRAAYRDFYDVMAGSWEQIGSLNVVQAAHIGLLPAAAEVAVGPSSPSMTVSLAAVSGVTGTRAVRLTDALGVTYWLEYRPATAQDAWLGTPADLYGFQPGVVLRRDSTGDDTSLLLDATPSPRSGWDADVDVTVPIGRPLALAAGAFTVTVRSEGTTAQVEIGTVQIGTVGIGTVGGPPPAAPVVSYVAVPGSGPTYYLNDLFTGQANTVFSYGDRGDPVYVGDWDGDHRDTLLVRRGNTFLVRNSNSSGPAEFSFTFGDPGDVVLVGDWDGDGRDTLAIRRGNRFYVKNDLHTGVADVAFSYGDAGDAVLVGDWNGDGKDTLTVRRADHYFVKNDTRSGVADREFVYGDPGDAVLVGRWSGSQPTDTLAVRRGNTYLLRYSLTSGVADRVVAYGNPSDTAFVGDWDGDGTDSLGVRRDAP